MDASPETIDKAGKLKEDQFWPKAHKKNPTYVFSNKQDIAGQIYQIGQDYYRRMQTSKGRPKHRFKFPVLLVKYLYFLYLTGCKPSEPLQKPYPTLVIVNGKDGVFVNLVRMNAKPKMKVEASIPVLSESEAKLWNFVTDGGTTTNTERIFSFSTWKSLKLNQIIRLIEKNFKASLRNAKTNQLSSKQGLTPKTLRIARAYDWIAQRKIAPNMVCQWLGVQGIKDMAFDQEMKSILDLSTHKNQISQLRESKILKPDFRIDEGERMGL